MSTFFFFGMITRMGMCFIYFSKPACIFQKWRNKTFCCLPSFTCSLPWGYTGWNLKLLCHLLEQEPIICDHLRAILSSPRCWRGPLALPSWLVVSCFEKNLSWPKIGFVYFFKTTFSNNCDSPLGSWGHNWLVWDWKVKLLCPTDQTLLTCMLELSWLTTDFFSPISFQKQNRH